MEMEMLILYGFVFYFPLYFGWFCFGEVRFCCADSDR